MFIGEDKNTHNDLNEFLNTVFKDASRRGSGTLELKTEMGRPDTTTFYELQFSYKPNRDTSNNILHTELRQVNQDDNYSINEIVKDRIYDVERKSKNNFNKIQIEKSKNSIYFHLVKLS